MNNSRLTDPIPILLVDDRPENLISLEALLSDQGYELVRASSGNEALRLTLKQDFALVLMDVQMPDMDGFETAELMRANPKTRHIQIIFVTAGMKDLQFQFKGYDAGAVDYLAKPIEPVFLQSKVRVFAELYSQRRELEVHKKHLLELVDLRTAELQQSAADLKTSNEQLLCRNKDLQSIEGLLRKQVVELVETHDQLLATEEMLRVQIEDFEIGQKLLNESNRSLQALFDVTPLAIVVVSFPGGNIREINRTFSDDFGYASDRVMGKRDDELGLWRDHYERERFLKLMHEQRNLFGFNAEINTFLGEHRTVLLYSTCMDFKDEKCLLIVFLDVTEQKRMEDQIRQTQKMEVVGQLAGGVAHDFNNMLTAISGSAELLECRVKDDSEALKLLANIQKAAHRSADLTSQLLTFSRKGQKNEVHVQIDSIIHEVVSLLEHTVDKKICLETKLVAKNSSVNGDPSLLQNALLNLGVNARDAMPEGGVITFATSNVDLDASYCATCAFAVQPGPYIEISVSDSGTGISQDIIDRVFEPFFTTKEVGKGTGLGLAAVYGTITDHHGCINIYSEAGLGTVFKLYLPLTGENDVESTFAEELIHGSCGVLLVDDEELVRMVGQSLLESMGYRVYPAENGEQALEVYARQKKDIALVILDVVMPVMGGKETLVRLMESDPDIRVLISSGFHQEQSYVDLLKLGAKGVLQKPYLRHELCKAVYEAIGDGQSEVAV